MHSYDRRQKRASHPKRHPWSRTSGQLGIESPWWQGVSTGSMGSHLQITPSAVIGHGLLKKALTEEGPPVHEASWDGNLIVPPKHLLDTCADLLKLRAVWVRGDTRNGSFTLANDQTMVKLTFYARGRQASVSAVTTSPKMVRYASQIFDRCLQPDDPSKGMVFTLAKTMHGYQLSHIGLAGSPIERSNYDPKVLTAYDHVVEDLNAESPCGRLVILAGEPGTGKTYLVRSLLGSVPKAAFVLVPPHLVEELGSPDILPSLTAAKSEMSGPIVMIIEDADACLVPRETNKTGNMNAISSLLNLGDGILGSVLDLRIIATTNAAKIEMDPAISRPGRLCKYSSVGALKAEQANTILLRLTGRKTASFTQEATLAAVYHKAREMGWKPPPATKTATTSTPDIRLEILERPKSL